MTNLYTQLKHPEIYWQYCGFFAFLPRKGIFSYLSTTPYHTAPVLLTMGTQQPGSSGLAQGHRGGKRLRSGVLKWTRAYTPRHHKHSERWKHTQIPRKPSLICFHLGSFLPFFLSSHQCAVQRRDKEHGPGQTPAAPWPSHLTAGNSFVCLLLGFSIFKMMTNNDNGHLGPLWLFKKR